MGIQKTWLILYNVAQSIGWWFIFATLVIGAIQSEKNIYTAYETTGFTIFKKGLFQSLALLEILHSIIGVTSTAAGPVMIQILGRLFQLGVIYNVPQIHNDWVIFSLFTAWSTIEIVRYPFYTISLFTSTPPKFMVWLRYSLFIILYPWGITSETLVLYKSIPFAEISQFWSGPTPIGFYFDVTYLLWLGVVLTPSLGLVMMSHSFALRSKKLSNNKNSKPKRR